jgi:hypothetical protein
MANTIDADLLCDTLATKASTFLGARLAPLRAFSRNFSEDGMAQAAEVQVPRITAGSTTLTNPTSFEAGDSTTSNIAVTVNHISQPFHVASGDYNKRIRLEQLALGNLQAFGNAISDVWTALVVDANVTPAQTTVAQASFAAANAKALWGNIAACSEKHLLLDGVAFAQLAPSDKNAFQLGESGAYGYDGIHLQTRWTNALANTYGLACGPEFIAIAAGIPMQVPGLAERLVAQRTINVEGLALSIQMNVWVSTVSRALWASYDVMFGAALADPAAASIVISA